MSQVARKIKGAISIMRTLTPPPTCLQSSQSVYFHPPPCPEAPPLIRVPFRSPTFSSMSAEPSSDDIPNTGSMPLQDRTNTRFETELAEKEEEIARLTGLVKGLTKKRGRGRRRVQFVCVLSQAFD